MEQRQAVSQPDSRPVSSPYTSKSRRASSVASMTYILERMNHQVTTQRSRIDGAFAAQLELLSGGLSGAATYRVHGLSEPCILKVIEAESEAYIRARGSREILFYQELAAHLPLHTPRVLASLIEESGFCALLLTAHEPLQPANELGVDVFAEIATQLAQFHAVYWGRTQELVKFSWLAKPTPPDLTNDTRHARERWQALAQRPQFRELLTESTLQEIEAALVQLRTVSEYGPDTAMTLCHGDCHLGNLLRDQEGHLIWADWQEVRIGHGPSDLSFLIQRAEANGADIAHGDIITAYCNALEGAGVKGVDNRAIMSAIKEYERRTRLLYWPDYMGNATTESMAYHLERIFSV